MKNTSKVKFVITIAKVAVLFEDGTTKITDEELVGKYTLNNARKFIKSGEYSTDFSEDKTIKNIEVLSVEHTQTVFTVDTDELYVFAQSNRIEDVDAGADDSEE